MREISCAATARCYQLKGILCLNDCTLLFMGSNTCSYMYSSMDGCCRGFLPDSKLVLLLWCLLQATTAFITTSLARRPMRS